MANLLKIKCRLCSKELLRYPSLIGPKGVFCSKECMDENRRTGNRFDCEHCGSKFYRRKGEYARSNRKPIIKKYCSKECHSKDRIKNAKASTYLKFGGVHRHIVIAQKALGRSLRKGEIVHHIDENKHNNAIKNLAVLPSQKFHARVHFGGVNFDKYRLQNMTGRRT